MSSKFNIRFRITITEKYTGKEKTHEGDLTTVINYLDANSNFEQTISELNRAILEEEIMELNDYQTAKIERVLQ
jgi:hypothetical protein